VSWEYEWRGQILVWRIFILNWALQFVKTGSVVVAFNESESYCYVITAYRPDLERFENDLPVKAGE